MENLLRGVKAILFDLDGTVYLDGNLIGDAAGTLDYLRSKGITVGYLTNNSSRTDDEYYERFKKIGIWDEKDIFLSSLGATAEYLNVNYAGKTVCPIAMKSCIRYLIDAGVNVIEKGKELEADILLLCFDRELTYEKLCIANELLVKGAYFIATHPDDVCPTAGVAIPDNGAFMALLKTSSGRYADFIVGKPNSCMAEIIAKKLGLKPQEILMVGDRLYTDIKFGINAGLKTALVLSGESSLADYERSGLKVDVVLDDMNLLKNYF